MAVSTLSSPPLPVVERRAVLPNGFRTGGSTAGIKASGRPDLGLIVAPGDVR
jgi:N-acetylglutamate synthase/N-acetylornithine aminotransferase